MALYIKFFCICICVTFQVQASDQRFTPIVKAVQKVKSSVVSIRGEKVKDDGSHVNSMGTGFVINSQGYIVTNYHVVNGVLEIQIITEDNKKHIGKIIDYDAEIDLALIKVNASLKRIIPVSSNLMQGETVFTIGNPFGYGFSVTHGIVSSLHREVKIEISNYDDLIQVDVPINVGNSGGALFNIDGDMIGIISAVRSNAQGIAFAIPVDKVVNVVTVLASNSVKSWHGIVAAHNDFLLSGMKIAIIEKKSPADNAGFKVGDVIIKVDDIEVQLSVDFQCAMLERKIGDKVKITIQRDGKPLGIDLMLSKIPDSVSKQVSNNVRVWEVLGLELQPMSSTDFKQRFHTRYHGGLKIIDVRNGSLASKQGIRSGDVLVGLHIWETVSLKNVDFVLKRPDFNSILPIKFFILRGNETLFGFL